MTAFYRIGIVFVLLLPSTASLQADASSRPAPAPAPASTNVVPPANSPPVTVTPSLYNFTVNSLDGKPVNLAQYQGHVALVVNTASHGGFTSQYSGLEKIYEDYKDKGFIVLAFPCNDFGGQETSSPKEIAKLCSDTYHVTFPLFEKITTRGDGKSPVYGFLTTGHDKPQWNFHKYLVNKSGKVIAEFPSQMNPEDKRIREAIEAALKG